MRRASPWRTDPRLADTLRPGCPASSTRDRGRRGGGPGISRPPRRNVRRGVHQALDGFLELVGGGASAPSFRSATSTWPSGAARHAPAGHLDALLAPTARVLRWPGAAGRGRRRTGLPPHHLPLAEAIFAYIDDISAASAEGFARSSRWPPRAARAPPRLVELLLPSRLPRRGGRGGGGRRRLALPAAGGPGRRRRVTRGPGAAPPEASSPRRRRRLGDRARPRRARPARRAALARAVGAATVLGPTVGRRGGASVRRARIGMRSTDWAGRAGARGRPPARPLLADDPVLARDLARRALGPLDELARRLPAAPARNPRRVARRARRRAYGRRAAPRPRADGALPARAAPRAPRRLRSTTLPRASSWRWRCASRLSSGPHRWRGTYPMPRAAPAA